MAPEPVAWRITGGRLARTAPAGGPLTQPFCQVLRRRAFVGEDFALRHDIGVRPLQNVPRRAWAGTSSQLDLAGRWRLRLVIPTNARLLSR